MERSVAGILLKGSKVLIARRSEGESFSHFWEFPGGKVEAGESDEDALRREFKEELDLPIQAIRLIGEVQFPHRGLPRILAAWLVDADGEFAPRMIVHEHLDWVGVADLPGLTLVDSDRKLVDMVARLLE